MELEAPILVDRKTAARLLSVSVRTVDNLIACKQLRPRRVGRRILFERQALVLFAKGDHRTQPAREKTGQ